MAKSFNTLCITLYKPKNIAAMIAVHLLTSASGVKHVLLLAAPWIDRLDILPKFKANQVAVHIKLSLPNKIVS